MGVPTYFRVSCLEAQKGGDGGYGNPGYALASHLYELPDDTEGDEWLDQVERLIGFLEAGEDEVAWDWFVSRYPRAMELVPRRRKDSFIEGVQRAHEDGKVEP